MKTITLNLSLPEHERANSVRDAKSGVNLCDHANIEEAHRELDRQYQIAICNRIEASHKREVVAQLLSPSVSDEVKRMVSDDAVARLFEDMVAGGAVTFNITWTV